MRHATRIGRLGGLAVGLGIGAVLAATGTASADPAITSSPFDPNVAASVDGMTLFRDASATAASGIGIGDIGAPVAATGTASADPAAVALPPFDWNNFAVSVGGDTLFQVGSAHALTGFDGASIAIADGANAVAGAGLAFLGPAPFPAFDSALAYGPDTRAQAIESIFGSAAAFGTGSTAAVTGFGSGACVIGPNADAEAGGVFNFASILNTGSGFDQALAGDTAGGFLSPATFDIASIVGTDSTAFAGSDPAIPGSFGSFDLAAAFGDMLHATATGGNFLVDILP